MIVFKRNNLGITAVHATPPQKRELGTRRETAGAFAEGSITRAKSKIREYVANSNFNAFCTFTFSGRKFDRHNFMECRKFITDYFTHKLMISNWLVVPEFHADGAIHFHGFMNIDKKSLKYGYSKKDSRGRMHMHFYSEAINRDIGRNDFQFFTPTSTNELKSVCAYILKYVTKDVAKVFPLVYFCSRGLKKDTVILRLEKQIDVQGFFSFCDTYNIREYSTAHCNLFFLTEEQYLLYIHFRWFYDVQFSDDYQIIELHKPQQMKI